MSGAGRALSFDNVEIKHTMVPTRSDEIRAFGRDRERSRKKRYGEHPPVRTACQSAKECFTADFDGFLDQHCALISRGCESRKVFIAESYSSFSNDTFFSLLFFHQISTRLG